MGLTTKRCIYTQCGLFTFQDKLTFLEKPLERSLKLWAMVETLFFEEDTHTHTSSPKPQLAPKLARLCLGPLPLPLPITWRPNSLSLAQGGPSLSLAHESCPLHHLAHSLAMVLALGVAHAHQAQLGPLHALAYPIEAHLYPKLPHGHSSRRSLFLKDLVFLVAIARGLHLPLAYAHFSQHRHPQPLCYSILVHKEL